MIVNDIKLLHKLLEDLAAELPSGNPPDELQQRAKELAHLLGYFVYDPESLKNFSKILEDRKKNWGK